MKCENFVPILSSHDILDSDIPLPSGSWQLISCCAIVLWSFWSIYQMHSCIYCHHCYIRQW